MLSPLPRSRRKTCEVNEQMQTMFGIHDWLLGLPVLGQCAAVLAASAAASLTHALLLRWMFPIPMSGTVFLVGLWTILMWSCFAMTATTIPYSVIALVDLVLVVATVLQMYWMTRPTKEGDDSV